MQADPDTFLSVLSPVEAVLYKEKGSKFLGHLYPIADLEEIKSHIALARRSHPNARHCCYAYRIGAPCVSHGFHDDGEPARTAGAPIYNQILCRDLSDVLLIVVRYFGGIKLGVGGLIRAYRNCADETLKRASIVEKFLYEKYLLEFRYDQINSLYQIIKQWDAAIHDQNHQEKCRLRLSLKKSKAPSFEEALRRAGLNYAKIG